MARDIQTEIETAERERGYKAIEQVAQMAYEVATKGERDYPEWDAADQLWRDPFRDVARVVLQWAASADRADLQAAALVARKETNHDA